MKKTLLTSLFCFIMVLSGMAQEKADYRIPLIGERAPAFEAKTTMGDINFPGEYFGKWKILFSHPADFTPVCTSEILMLASMQEQFKKLQTELVVVSTDGLNSHIQWVESMQEIKFPKENKQGINFPLIADPDHSISKLYGMIHPYSSSTKDVRGVFIIDPDDKVRALFFYPLTTGRNLDEIKRALIALQESEKRNVLTPVNWTPGDDVLIPAPASVAEARKLENKKDQNLYSLAWYMWFKKSR